MLQAFDRAPDRIPTLHPAIALKALLDQDVAVDSPKERWAGRLIGHCLGEGILPPLRRQGEITHIPGFVNPAQTAHEPEAILQKVCGEDAVRFVMGQLAPTRELFSDAEFGSSVQARRREDLYGRFMTKAKICVARTIHKCLVFKRADRRHTAGQLVSAWRAGE